MKFKDVKPGDTVYFAKKECLSIGRSKTFFLPEKVVSVSKAEFKTTRGERIRKDTGKCTGLNADRTYYREGEKHYSISVYDQTKEFETFKRKLEIEERTFSLLLKLSQKDFSVLFGSKLTEIQVTNLEGILKRAIELLDEC